MKEKIIYTKPTFQVLGKLNGITKGTTALKFDAKTKGSQFTTAP